VPVSDADGAYFLGILDGNGAQTDGVNELENGRVCANAEGQSQNGDNRESRAEAEKPEAVANVLPQ